MNHMGNGRPLHFGVQCLLIAAFAGSVLAQTPSPPTAAAEVLDVQGTGERRSPPTDAWQAARPRDALSAGNLVRTGAVSRMALLFADETQLRLNQNTLLEIRSVGGTSAQPTTLRLAQGRAWTQSKRVPDGLRLETPAAVAAVRGTDWELEVAPDGRSLVVVFSGAVDYFNEQGSLTVVAGESAVADVGKAPVRIVLASPGDRVQWVNALRFNTERFEPAARALPALRTALSAIAAGDFERAVRELAAARAAGVNDPRLIEAQAELALVTPGPYARAIAIADQGLAVAPRDADLLALRSRALLLADRIDDARQTLARPHDEDTASFLIAQGDLARREGFPLLAIERYTRATQVAPDDARAWHALGRAQSEREDYAPARRHLQRALVLDPSGAGYAGELGTLETFGNQFRRADRAFASALAANPADYVALTGRALQRLKQGEAAQALDDLLRAGVMEPRYARAKVYTGVAYYQLGRHADAITTLNEAALLDDKDPLPWTLLSLIHTDRFEAGRAVAASREALARLPYLKSLNQVADDQQGKANLGYALAFFGLEDWALEIAQQSYYPYAGSSHLFLADRYRGDYNKNSELFAGFLADPTSFGGSNRFSKLVPTAGHYATLGLTREIGNEARDVTAYARANGLFDVTIAEAGVRGAYFVDAERLWGTLETRVTDDGERVIGDNRATFGAVGLGAMLTPQLGAFGYGTALEQDVKLRDFSGTEASLDKKRVDLGTSYRFAPTTLAWLKVGRSDEERRFDNYVVVDAVNGTAQTARSRFDSRPQDVQLRVTADLTAADQISVGVEHADDRRFATLAAAGAVLVGDDVFGIGTIVDRRVDLSSRHAYVSYIRELTPSLMLQADLGWTSFRQSFDEAVDSVVSFRGETQVSTDSTRLSARDSRIDPRVGVVWRPGPFVLRAAWQRWTRPAGVSTLAPITTAGIAMDDVLLSAGGRAERAVVKLHYEPDAFTALGAFYDDIDVRNLGDAGFRIPTPEIEFVDLLRNQQILNVATFALREGTPEFDRGRARSAGFFVNRIVTPSLSLAARYVHTRDTAEIYVRDENGQIVADVTGARIPFVSRHQAIVGTTLVLPARFYVSAQAVWRSLRFTDRENTPRAALRSDVNGQLVAFWESADKRFIVGVAAVNLGSKAQAERYLADVRVRF
ncbi:MAG TPA: FecR domain-containing protein [Casimicrobiaceae bacterium]|nr:FecR domain-containing protein [Casimicrobiaceae bacterium]